jgi:hypothetical protein
MIQPIFFVHFVLVGLLISPHVWAQHQDVRMPVQYDHTMLVLVSEHGVAALKFENPFEIGNETRNGVTGVSYKWRFLAISDDADEESGSGRVFVKLNDGQVEDRKSEIACGPLKMKWHYADRQLGFVDYSADQLQVYPLTPSLFALQPLFPGSEAIDLRLFQNTAEKTKEVEKRVASPAVYDNCTLIIRNAEGTVIITFGAAYEKEESATEKRYGVPYHSVFVSADGQSKTETDDEVYERYTNGAYDRGKLEITSGPIRLEWSQGGKNLGWVYYPVGNTRVWYVDNKSVNVLLKSLEQQ